MSEPTSSALRALFDEVRAAEDALPAEIDLARAHARLRETIAARRLRRAVPLWVPRVALPALVLALLVVVLRRDRPSTNASATSVATTSIGAGAWLDPGVAVFGDGTRVEVAPDGRARVDAADALGATVRIDHGRLDAAVVHRDRARWHFRGGPFDVLVTGTRFDLAWDPAARRLHLAMREGSVLVTGPGLGAGRAIVAGQELDASDAAAADDAPRAADTAATSATSASDPRADRDVAAERRHVTAAPASWRDLARAARWGDALAAAERAGFADECAHDPPADVLLLGDVARLAGNEARARDAYLSVRRRFPRDPRAAEAAFFLGRLAFERRGDASDAARWFDVALREQPNGPLAREALGRSIEAREAAGEDGAARDAARAYLARYPGGPHAARARDVLRGE